MKYLLLPGVLMACSCFEVFAQNALVNTVGTTVTNLAVVSYVPGQAGPHSREWLRVSGNTSRVAFVELATGLNYWDSNSNTWVPSSEQIVGYPGGAVASQGQCKVIFANNLNTDVAIDFQTPDSKRLQSRILGLSYFDKATGSNVLFAEIQDCSGIILPPNQVFYQNAFNGIKASVLYTYTKAKFEQCVVLQQRPPLPETFGLNSASTMIQVLTEFASASSPTVTLAAIQTAAGAVQDQTLDFGAIKMSVGRAFSTSQDPLSGAVVVKQWLNQAGGAVLVEQLPVTLITTQLDQLPIASQVNPRPRSASLHNVVFRDNHSVPKKHKRIDHHEMKVATGPIVVLATSS